MLMFWYYDGYLKVDLSGKGEHEERISSQFTRRQVLGEEEYEAEPGDARANKRKLFLEDTLKWPTGAPIYKPLDDSETIESANKCLEETQKHQ